MGRQRWALRLGAIPDQPSQFKMARSARRAEPSDDVARARCFGIGLTSSTLPLFCLPFAIDCLPSSKLVALEREEPPEQSHLGHAILLHLPSMTMQAVAVQVAARQAQFTTAGSNVVGYMFMSACT